MYQSPNKKIWTGRNDPFDGEDGHLWHHVVEVVDMEKNLVPAAHPNQVAILGFASDEGVKRNQGRPGAKDGPDVIRKACLLYTSPSPRDRQKSRMPSSA